MPLPLGTVGASCDSPSVTSDARPIDALLSEYLTTRGLDPAPFVTKGTKILEECDELIVAFRLYRECPSDHTFAALMHEVADVVLAVAVLARQEDFTIEEAIAAKIERDAGRGYKSGEGTT